MHRSVVWMNDEEAHIFRLDPELASERTIHAAAQQPGLDNAGQALHAPFFQAVARALDPADEILITGPSGTQHAFAKYMHKGDHALDPRVRGVETVARLTDDALSAFAKLYFARRFEHDGHNGSE